MVWNLRFITFEDPFSDNPYAELNEVYYNQNNEPQSYSRPHLIFESLDEIEAFIERVYEASAKPFLSEDDFPIQENINDPWCDPQAEN